MCVRACVRVCVFLAVAAAAAAAATAAAATEASAMADTVTPRGRSGTTNTNKRRSIRRSVHRKAKSTVDEEETSAASGTRSPRSGSPATRKREPGSPAQIRKEAGISSPRGGSPSGSPLRTRKISTTPVPTVESPLAVLKPIRPAPVPVPKAKRQDSGVHADDERSLPTSPSPSGSQSPLQGSTVQPTSLQATPEKPPAQPPKASEVSISPVPSDTGESDSTSVAKPVGDAGISAIATTESPVPPVVVERVSTPDAAEPESPQVAAGEQSVEVGGEKLLAESSEHGLETTGTTESQTNDIPAVETTVAVVDQPSPEEEPTSAASPAATQVIPEVVELTTSEESPAVAGAESPQLDVPASAESQAAEKPGTPEILEPVVVSEPQAVPSAQLETPVKEDVSVDDSVRDSPMTEVVEETPKLEMDEDDQEKSDDIRAIANDEASLETGEKSPSPLEESFPAPEGGDVSDEGDEYDDEEEEDEEEAGDEAAPTAASSAQQLTDLAKELEDVLAAVDMEIRPLSSTPEELEDELSGYDQPQGDTNLEDKANDFDDAEYSDQKQAAGDVVPEASQQPSTGMSSAELSSGVESGVGSGEGTDCCSVINLNHCVSVVT